MEIKDVKGSLFLESSAAFEIYSQCMYKATFEEYKAEIAGLSARSDIHIFAVICQGDYAGMIVLERQADNTAVIIGIAVKKALQRRGIGQFMVQRASGLLQADRIIAETDDEAVEFYRKSGFGTTKFIRHFPDGDAVRYDCVCCNLHRQA